MTDTIEPVKLDDEENMAIARTMVAQARASGVDLVGPDGLLAGLTKQVLEFALEEELTDHLGYPPGEREAKTGSNQAMAGAGHPLRQARHHLPRRRRPRCLHHLVTGIGDTP